jgi:hypothetical protein
MHKAAKIIQIAAHLKKAAALTKTREFLVAKILL